MVLVPEEDARAVRLGALRIYTAVALGIGWIFGPDRSGSVADEVVRGVIGVGIVALGLGLWTRMAAVIVLIGWVWPGVFSIELPGAGLLKFSLVILPVIFVSMLAGAPRWSVDATTATLRRVGAGGGLADSGDGSIWASPSWLSLAALVPLGFLGAMVMWGVESGAGELPWPGLWLGAGWVAAAVVRWERLASPSRGWSDTWLLVPPLCLAVALVGLDAAWWLFGLAPVVAALAIHAWPGQGMTLVFDGGCGLCRRALVVAKALDWTETVAVVNLRDWAEVHRRFPDLDEAACIRDIHGVMLDGAVRVGFACYQALAWRLPPVAFLAWILYLPPIPQLGRAVYRRVADGRNVDGCGAEACPVERTKD